MIGYDKCLIYEDEDIRVENILGVCGEFMACQCITIVSEIRCESLCRSLALEDREFPIPASRAKSSIQNVSEKKSHRLKPQAMPAARPSRNLKIRSLITPYVYLLEFKL